MAMPQCCYLAKGAKRPSHTTNTTKFDRIPFDPCNSIKRFDLSPFDQKNSTYLQPPICPVRSLTYRLKSSGPKIVPWGTPCFSSNISDLTLFNETCCSLSLRKLFIKLMAEDEKPRDLSLDKRISCESESKAFDKSSKTA